MNHTIQPCCRLLQVGLLVLCALLQEGASSTYYPSVQNPVKLPPSSSLDLRIQTSLSSSSWDDSAAHSYHKYHPLSSSVDRILSNHHHRLSSPLRNLLDDQENNATTDEETVDCPENPFMWKIYHNETPGTVAGIGIGTMHVPPPLITTTDSWISILNALKDVCTVYGEHNPFDPVATTQLLKCFQEANQDAATILDIPEGEVRDAYLAKAQAIAQELHGGDDVDSANATTLVDEAVARFAREPLITGFLVTVSFRNSPEYVAYENSLADSPHRDQLLLPIDFVLQASGRPGPAGLETVEAQCDGLKSIILTKEDLAANFTQHSTMLLRSLEDQSLSTQINAYRCGNTEHFKEVYLRMDGAEEILTDELTDDRNILMAESMVTIMKDSPTLPMFAVGLGHWILGDKTLEVLLAEHGYSVERVDAHGVNDLEDLSDEMCGAAGATATSTATTGSDDASSQGPSSGESSPNDGGLADAEEDSVLSGEVVSSKSIVSSATYQSTTGSIILAGVALWIILRLGIIE